MEITLFLLALNSVFFSTTILLRFHQLIGLLATIYLLIWTIAIYLFVIFSSISIPFLTYTGISVIYLHLLVVMSATFVTFNAYHKVFAGALLQISIPSFYFFFLGLATLGIFMVLYTTDVWTFYVQNQLAEMRGEILDQNITVNRYWKFMGNFVYPLAIIAPLYFFRQRKNVLALIAVVLLGALLSFSNGGKGNLLIVVLLLMGGIIYFLYHRKVAFPAILKKTVVLLGIAMLGFFYFINSTRVGEDEGFSIGDSVVLFNEYFTNSIPSFCQWIELNDIPLVDFKIGQTAILREAGSFIGIANPRIIDQQVVNIPQRFNVYTAFADSIAAFGWIGSILYYLLIGAIIGLIDLVPRNDQTLFLFSTFFLFACYSLFTDIFFYMIGSWICLSFYWLFNLNPLAKHETAIDT